MAFVLALALLGQFPLDENAAAFEPVDEARGIALLSRPVKGSPYREYQARTTTPVGVKDLCDGVFEWATLAPESPGLSGHQLLLEADERRVIYAHISQPVVANRDYVLEVRRERFDDGRCRLRFRTTTEGAPPRPPGFVRMDKVWGEWVFTATAGGTAVSYTLFSDPAGSIPAFLVHGSQKAVTRDTVALALERVKQAVAKRATPSLQQR